MIINVYQIDILSIIILIKYYIAKCIDMILLPKKIHIFHTISIIVISFVSLLWYSNTYASIDYIENVTVISGTNNTKIKEIDMEGIHQAIAINEKTNMVYVIGYFPYH